MRQLLILAVVTICACAPEPGSQRWCDAKNEQPKSEWTGNDLATFTKHCVIESMTIGSKAWCEGLSKKPKGEWTANDAASYAQNCVM